jgi:mRNA interferase MazF
VRGDIVRLRAPRDAVGHEQQGSRYGVIVQSDDVGLSTTIVAPTSTSAHGYSFRPEITVRGIRTRVMVDQLRAVDNGKAFGDYVGHVSPHEMADIIRAMRDVLEL